MSKHQFDIRIISLDKHFSTVELQRVFPKSEVHIQTAVDIRKANLKNIYNSGIIGQAGYESINEGRKRHCEFSSIGGVGLALANRFAMMNHVERSLLLFEDDFLIQYAQKFVNELDTLTMHMDIFDLAVFGANYRGDLKNLEPVPFMSKGWYYMLKGRFWHTHCVFYSPKGRQKVSSLLSSEPMDMQIDGLYAFWAETKGLRVILQVKDATVTQKWHHSSIQTDNCKICDIHPSHDPSVTRDSVIWKLIALVSLVLVVASVCIRNRS